MKLVIVESPAKAQTINKYLGNDYKVMASVGHIRDLPSKDGAVLPDENFKMSWEMHKDKEKVVKEIIDDGINILFDAQGHSSNNRLTVFFYKPAPVQVTWLGQGSTGIPEIDYFVGNEIINPKSVANGIAKYLSVTKIVASAYL